MSETAHLRRHLYDQYAQLPLRARRDRRRLRRQVALLAAVPPPGGGADPGGVREPRRPVPPHGGPGRGLPLPR